MRLIFPVLAFVAVLSACANSGHLETSQPVGSASPSAPADIAPPASSSATHPSDKEDASNKEQSRAQKTEAEFADALVAPLADLNLVRTPIPPILLAAAKDPYGTPKDGSCAGLSLEVSALNQVLGADLDTTPSAGNPGLLERGSDLATDAVVNAIRDSTTGLLPFRGWIRRLTGANKHAKAAIAAISAGAVRRAYLKGLGQAAHCAPPAAPAPLPPPAAATPTPPAKVLSTNPLYLGSPY